MTNSQLHYNHLTAGILLAAAAGGIDAYSYLLHGEVFAGLQTGNFILLGINLGQHHFIAAGHYLLSITMFFIGTLIAKFIQDKYRGQFLDRSTLILMYEILILATIGLLETHLTNLVATGLLSITAAAQLNEFNNLKGRPFTSLMMTGNLKSLAQGTYDALVLKDAGALEKTKDTLLVIGGFSLGALSVGFLTIQFATFAILAPITLLITVMAVRKK